MNRSATVSRKAAELLAVGQLFRQYGGEKAALDVAREGGGLAELHNRIGASISRDEGLSGLDRAAGLSIADKEVLRDWSFSRLIRTAMNATSGFNASYPNQFDKNNDFLIADVHRRRSATCHEIEWGASIPSSARMGGGLAVPWTALTRDFNVGTSNQAGNLVAAGSKDLTMTPDANRNALALQRLGALMPGGFRQTFSVPLLTADQTNVGYVSEVGAASEGEPTSGLVTFEPKRVTTFIEVSKQAVIQGGDVMDMLIQRAMFSKAIQVMESAAINGDGTGDNPVGIRSTSGVSTLVGGPNGAQLNFGHILDLENGPAVANAAETAFTGYIMNAQTRRWLKSTQRASGLPFIWDGAEKPVNGHQALMTNNLPNNLAKGSSGTVCSSVVYSSDWQMLMMPIYGVPEITVDPYKLADQGKVRLILNIYMSAGLLCPSAFSKMDDALTA